MTPVQAATRGIGLGSALLAAACTGEPPPAEPSDQVVTSLAQIAGTWDIARFDGYQPTRLHGGVRQAYVHVRSDRLSYAIECNHSGNAARIDGAGTLHDDEGGRSQTLMGCPAEQSARDRAFFWFFASRPKVSRAGAERVRMWNGTTELLLERPELRRLAHLVAPQDLTGRWVPLMATARNPKTGSTAESFEQTVRVVMGPRELRYTGCGRVRFTFRQTREGRLTDVAEQGRAACGDDFASATLLRIMRSRPLVERDATGLALTAGDMAVNLQPEAELRRLTPTGDTPEDSATAAEQQPVRRR